MSRNDDLTTAIVALGALGLGVAGFAALSRWEKKRTFLDALRAGLEEHDVGLVAADVGRSEDGGPAWFVTVSHPWTGILSYHVDFDHGTDLYAAQTLNDLVDRLVRAMPAITPARGTG
jgi:hypothetical protein